MTEAAASANCGGLSLLWKDKEEDLFRMENQKVMGPNVLKFEFVTGKPQRGDEERYFVVGCYVPPSDKDGTTRQLIESTMLLKPKGAIPIIMGDLNAHLEVPRTYQEELLADLIGTWGVECISRDFTMRSTTRKTQMGGRGRWSWRQRRTDAVGEGRWLSSKPDYILTRPEDHKRYKRCRIVRPLNHNTDHRAMIVRVRGRGKHAMRRYRQGIAKFPIQLPKGGPRT